MISSDHLAKSVSLVCSVLLHEIDHNPLSLCPLSPILTVQTGLHTEALPFNGLDAYNKNLHIQFGRCPVRSVFMDALQSLKRNSKLRGFIDTIIPLEEYSDALRKFERNEVFKVIFKPNDAEKKN